MVLEVAQLSDMEFIIYSNAYIYIYAWIKNKLNMLTFSRYK